MVTLIEKAVSNFGITTNIKEAGYILIDGSLLDMSEKNNGGTKGHRSADHRDISVCYDNIIGTQALIQFMNDGNIRLLPERGCLNISVMPTSEQYDTIINYVNFFKGEIMFEISSREGISIFSKEYKLKTASEKIIKDIKEFFSNQR